MHFSSFVMRLWAALLLSFSLVAATAQPASTPRDDGDYQILQALYGTARSHIDVTPRLRELARVDRAVRMGNDTFGADPDPGQRKTLRIYARGRDGETRVFDFPEGGVVDGAQFTGWTGGNFGDNNFRGGWQGATAVGQPQPQSPVAGRDDGDFTILQALYGTARNYIDVTPRLRELARQDRSLRMGNATFGANPDPGEPKTLRIYARGRDGQTRVFSYPQNGVVDGSQFVGWSRGEFGDGTYRGEWGSRDEDRDRRADARDEGEYQILQALYGTARNYIDVTPRLRELARQDRSLRMGNATFGANPDPGEPKTLRIYARGRDGQTRVFSYPQNGVVDGSQFVGWSRGEFGDGTYRGEWGSRDEDRDRRAGDRDEGEYRILQALYGSARRHVDVTDRLRQLARSDEEMRVTRSAFNVDPDPGQPKTLRIYARGRDDQVRMFEFRHGSIVDGSQFRGWRGGNWAGRDGYRGNWNGEQRAEVQAPTLRIVSATWGTGSRKRDVTERLRTQVHNGRIEAVVDDNLTGSDPAPGVRKTLWVTYAVDGRTQQARVDENGQLSIP